MKNKLKDVADVKVKQVCVFVNKTKEICLVENCKREAKLRVGNNPFCVKHARKEIYQNEIRYAETIRQAISALRAWANWLEGRIPDESVDSAMTDFLRKMLDKKWM